MFPLVPDPPPPAAPRPKRGQEELQAMRQEVGCLASLFRVFRHSALLLDEVDLLLHPLRSELHWPLGVKVSLPQPLCISHL